MADQLNAGALRKLLGAANATWRIDDRLDDAAPIKRYPLGVDLAKVVRAQTLPHLDIRPFVGEISANPFLRQRRIEQGFLKVDRLPEQIRDFRLPLPGAQHFDGAADVAAMNVSGRMVGPAAAAPLQAMTGTPGRAASVDWRNRWGWPWLTKIKDQDPCESCWCFGAVGVVEAMARIEHAVWALRSEGDVHDGMGTKCADGGWPSHALDYMKAHGVADAGCWPYHTDDAAYKPSSDRLGRTVRIDDYVSLGSVDDQKTWLDSVGPLTACFTCYNDFFGYGPNSGTYTANTNTGVAGGHCIVIVGYDDAKQAWLVRNSWNTGWGMAGYCWFGYGQADIDNNAKYGVAASAVNPDPWTKRRMHAGNFIESGNGANHRNFEVWAPAPGNAIRHYWREGYGSLDWHVAETQGNDMAVPGPTVTGTTYDRNFEMIYRTTANRLHHRFFDQASAQWKDGPVFGPANVGGTPASIQGDFGAPGNFEVVVRLADGTLQHWWRNAGNFAWAASATFGQQIAFSAPALVQRADRGLDLIAVNADGTMQRWMRDASFRWQAYEKFGANVHSEPVLLEGEFAAPDETAQGNYELCVQVGGAVQHWWRNNVAGAGTWSMSATFGSNVARVLGMIEGSFGFDLEVVVELADGRLQHFWRNNTWHAGPVFGTVH